MPEMVAFLPQATGIVGSGDENCPGHKKVSDFVQKHFVSATNVSQFVQPKKHHGQQCVRNNVSSFARVLKSSTMVLHVHFESLYISLPSSAKQQREMTYVFRESFCVFPWN